MRLKDCQWRIGGRPAAACDADGRADEKGYRDADEDRRAPRQDGAGARQRLEHDLGQRHRLASCSVSTRRRPATRGARAFAFDYRINDASGGSALASTPPGQRSAARREVKALRQRVDRGEDPALEKREAREAPTVADLAQRYRLEHLSKKAPRSQTNNWAMIVNDILPDLGARKAADVHQGDMVALHRKIAVSGRPVHANRVLAVASTMFSLSLNPMAGEAPPMARRRRRATHVKASRADPEQGRERFFSPDELAAIGEALDAYSYAPAADCLRLVLSTGCRPGEALAATWAEFAEPGIWVKPASGTKQRRLHRAPLSPDATKLVERMRLRREKGAEYVFPLGNDEPWTKGDQPGLGPRPAPRRPRGERAGLRSQAQLRQRWRARGLKRLGPGQAARTFERQDDGEVLARRRQPAARGGGQSRRRARRGQCRLNQARPRQWTLSAGVSTARRSPPSSTILPGSRETHAARSRIRRRWPRA